MKPVRVRIPPSPTGNLHVGTARAALFNELFARKHDGKIVLRFEDTDKQRSKKEFEDNIIEGLAWLGISYDEGPFRQSERTERYTAALQKLLQEDKAYKEEEAVRLRVTPQTVTFQDEVRGEVKVHTDSFEGDFIIARSETDPLYHLAVVVDDADMNITHVIRGEDHLHNTVKHILIQEALGYPRPLYAHLPLLLDDQRKKLSKRRGETSLLAYRDMGILPQAMLNYLALLGWNAGDDREFYTHEELVDSFSLERVQKGGAIFSLEKLIAMNKHYIRQLSPEDLAKAAKPFFEKEGVGEYSPELLGAIAIEQPRIATLAELPKTTRFAQASWSPEYAPNLLIWRKSTKEATEQILQQLFTLLSEYSENTFVVTSLQERLMAWIEEKGLGKGDVLWPLRVALTGEEHSAGPFEVASILGKDLTLTRIKTAGDILSKSEV